MSEEPAVNPYASSVVGGATFPKPDSAPNERVSIGEKIGYGLGDTASNFYWKLFENFQLIFYTDVFGISAAAAATMFFVTKLWDTFNDPIMGLVADRTRTAWGSFRPYLILGALPFAVTGMLTFYTPDLSPNGKLVYAYVTYTAVFMAYTLVNIPYGALMGVISSNSLERTSVSTYRFLCAFFGGLIVQKFTLPLVDFFGGMKTIVVDGVSTEIVDKQKGFFWTVTLFACVAVVLFIITFLTTKERVVPQQEKATQFRKDFGDLIRNRGWMVLAFVGLFQILADWTRGSSIAYYFNYVVYADLVNPEPGFVNSQIGNFMVAGTVASLLGMLLTKQMTRIFGKPLLMILMNLSKAVLTAAFFFLEKDQTTLMYVLNFTAAFVSGPVAVLLWSMYADVADYSEWKNHRRATGLVFSAATFSQKLGGALGSAVPGWTLAYFSFVAPSGGKNQIQSAETIFGIQMMMSIVPAVFLLGAVIALLFYNINERLLVQIESDLQQRKSDSLSN